MTQPRTFLILLSLVGFVLCSCTTPLKPELPIEVNGGKFFRSYSQEGNTVSFYEVTRALRENENFAGPGLKAEILFWGCSLAGGFGGYYLGSSFNSVRYSAEERKNNLHLGLGLLGATLICIPVISSYSDEALELYNNTKKKSKLAPASAGIFPMNNGLGFSLGWSY